MTNPVIHEFYEGDNLNALKILQKTYASKINFIYIDPPYNTGKTSFTYHDSKEWEEWLDFIKIRLELAKELLTENGCIFIAIGDRALYRLKILCDQIFGEENFVNDFMWLHGKGKKDKFSRTMYESNLCYAKNIKKLKAFSDYETANWAKSNIDNDSRGPWFSGSISFDEKRSNPEHPNFFEITSPSGIKWKRQWLITKDEMDKLLSDKKIYFGLAPDYSNVPRKKVFNGEKIQIIPKNLIDNAGSTRDAQNHLNKLLGEKNVFDNPKPVSLIQHFLKITDMEKDITVLDFFAGSGTTFEAVINQNLEDSGSRKCIICQKPEKILSESKFSTISELCLKRCRTILKNDDLLKVTKV